MEEMKKRIGDDIDRLRDPLLKLSSDIHSHPELAYQERQSAGFIVDALRAQGIEARVPYCGLATSFRADLEGSRKGPHVAILAEYDALPECGHGCGHNIIATSAVGAFLGMKNAMSAIGGKLSLIGTPGEEGGGGKIALLEGGGFDDIDFALMIHPKSGPSIIGRSGRAATHLFVSYQGIAAHSSNPSKGVNALSALRILFTLIDVMRPTLPPSSNINGVITKAGTVGNIIPDRGECEFSVRANTLKELEEVIAVIERCAKAAEMVVSAPAEIHWNKLYAERYPSIPLGEAFKKNMESLGETMEYPDPAEQVGSSDIGNVSIKIPVIHEYLSIAEEGVRAHSKEFAQAAISARGNEVCVKGAKGLAMTALDIFTDESLREKSMAYHHAQVPEIYTKKASNQQPRSKLPRYVGSTRKLSKAGFIPLQ
ncbi:MAG: M20 family metallopeptidase [Spirochaetales bacterium]